MFKRLDDDEALIVERGVYKSAEVYSGPGGGLFVKAKGGFVRLKADGSTSHDSVRMQMLQRNSTLYQDRFARLCAVPGENTKEVELQFDANEQITTFRVRGQIEKKP